MLLGYAFEGPWAFLVALLHFLDALELGAVSLSPPFCLLPLPKAMHAANPGLGPLKPSTTVTRLPFK